jgi:hypothetical protein
MMIFLFPTCPPWLTHRSESQPGFTGESKLPAESLRHRELYADPHRDGCLNRGVGGNLVA